MSGGDHGVLVSSDYLTNEQTGVWNHTEVWGCSWEVKSLQMWLRVSDRQRGGRSGEVKEESAPQGQMRGHTPSDSSPLPTLRDIFTSVSDGYQGGDFFELLYTCKHMQRHTHTHTICHVGNKT